MEKKMPDIVFQHGRCSSAIYRDIEVDGVVKRGAVKVGKRMRVGSVWKNAEFLDLDDIPKMILVLQKAYDYLTAGEEKG